MIINENMIMHRENNALTTNNNRKQRLIAKVIREAFSEVMKIRG